ncbi:Holliday junction branch migration protein RuvA [Zavarzinia sp. CC-PAN008]|uniref:Holliday junction branch migration protein RuvA n=1 Tax=Zavarzinia sp. CC-PAN008 TaxID=3243332 RepID=UPI003F746729
MIAKLSGRVDSLGEDWVILDVGGVGYLVHATPRTLQALGGAGTAASLAIETQVREDAITLYGFRDAAEAQWFRLLQTVQGVGAKVALSLLGLLRPDELTRAVGMQDKAALTRASGVGARLAQRIIVELSGRMPADLAVSALAVVPSGGAAAEAVSALVNLGYRPVEASTAVAAAGAVLGEAAAVDALIRAGLKELAR